VEDPQCAAALPQRQALDYYSSLYSAAQAREQRSTAATEPPAARGSKMEQAVLEVSAPEEAWPAELAETQAATAVPR